MSSRPRVALLTPEAGYRENWQPHAARMIALLGDHGIDVAPHGWSAVTVDDLDGINLMLPLFAWGYPRAADRWYAQLDAWQAAQLPVANPVTVMRWNTDKRYLMNLSAQEIATIPTILASALDDAALTAARDQFGSDRLIIKPPISAGADLTYLIEPDRAVPHAAHGRTMMIQPFVDSITTTGEWSLFLFDGVVSHAIVKTPATGDFRVQEQFGGRETAVADVPTAITDLAQSAVRAVPGGAPLYARVDMVLDGNGAPMIIELELIEPALFLHMAPDDGVAFAQAVTARLG